MGKRRRRSRSAAPGAQGFEEHYRERYGERWSRLQAALLRPPGYVALQHGLVKPYYLDGASALSVTTLPVAAGDRVLDLCAAPGGKTLALISAACSSGTAQALSITANERSRARRARLQRTLQEHLPDPSPVTVRVTGHDARRWGLYEQNAYDHVIADVPCSAERHLLATPPELTRWSPARAKRLAIDAYAILAAALTAVRPQGTVLYLTCALLDDENDAVVEKALKRFDGRVCAEPPQIGIGTGRRHGVQILPDQDDGRGPLYLARLRKSSC